MGSLKKMGDLMQCLDLQKGQAGTDFSLYMLEYDFILNYLLLCFFYKKVQLKYKRIETVSPFSFSFFFF